MLSDRHYRYLLPVTLILLFLLSIWLVGPFLVGVLGGLVVVYVFYPLYKGLKKYVKSRTVAALLISFFILFILILASFLVVNTISREAVFLFVEGKKILDGGSLIRQCGSSFCDYLEVKLADPQLQGFLQKGLQAATSNALEVASRFVVTIPRIVANLFIVFFVVFYGLRDSERFKGYLKKLLEKVTDHHGFLYKRFTEVLHGVLYGNLLIALIQGAIGALGFWLFGISSPLSWGLIMALFAIIPYGGTALIWFPASLLLVAQGLVFENSLLLWKAAGLFLYGFFIIAGIDNILKPRVIGTRSRSHPIVVLLGIFGGIALIGPVGIVVGPVILAMTMTLIKVYILGENKS